MKSVTTARFREHYESLPAEIQRRADKAYRLWDLDPRAPGLYFKRVGKSQPVYSVRIGGGYRALGLLDADTVIWFWIGHHDEYERLLKNM